VHQALSALSEDDQVRLGVITAWRTGPHKLTNRQTERTFGLVGAAPGKDQPDGQPSQALQAICDDLLEASIPEEFKNTSTSLAVDWTDMETGAPPTFRTADPLGSSAGKDQNCQEKSRIIPRNSAMKPPAW
jgi:hypothetical protein